jgi:hypothetical protein
LSIEIFLVKYRAVTQTLIRILFVEVLSFAHEIPSIFAEFCNFGRHRIVALPKKFRPFRR